MINLSQLTQSQAVLADLQSKYGTLISGEIQVIRKQYYSFVDYPAAGNSEFTFFGDRLGQNGLTAQFTNLPQAASFGTSSFLVKAIGLSYYTEGDLASEYTGADNTSLFTEIVGGLFNAGIFRLQVNSKTFVEQPMPFYTMPPLDGRRCVKSAKVDLITDELFGPYPWADLQKRGDNKFLMDPEIFIEAQQTFTAQLLYPSGSIAQEFDTLTDLRVGCILDGYEFRPVQ